MMSILIELTEACNGYSSQVKDLEVRVAVKPVVDRRKEGSDDQNYDARVV